MDNRDKIKSITIGSFDGMHLAHQKLASLADAVVVIERGGGYLTPGKMRCRYIDKPCLFYYFDDIRALSPLEFVDKLCNDFPNINKIVVGYDFCFGKGRSGDVQTLNDIFNGTVEVVKEIKNEGISIHSRTIKELLKSGDLKTVKRLLGRQYQVIGVPIRGQGVGSKELVPTINMRIEQYQLPKDGVYATKTFLDGHWHKSVTFIGNRVTTDGKFAIESHVINQEISQPDDTVTTEFIARIRDNQKFGSFTMLKKAIKADISHAKECCDER